MLPHSEVVTEIDDLPHVWSRSRIPILAPRRFLEADDLRPDPLPHAWTTTTDSIAARVATRIDAAELVLLKSTPLPPVATTWEIAATLGLVDPEFPRAARKIPQVGIVDLRQIADLSAKQIVEFGSGVGPQVIEPGGDGADDRGGAVAGEAVGMVDLAGAGADQDGALVPGEAGEVGGERWGTGRRG